MQCLALAVLFELDAIAHLVHRDCRALAVKILQFLKHMCRRRHDLWCAENLQLVTAAYHLAIEILLKYAKKLIAAPKQAHGLLLILEVNRLFHRLCFLQEKNPSIFLNFSSS